MKKASLLFMPIFFIGTRVLLAQTIVHFSQENAVQNWTVPAGVTTATITVGGAAGGGAANQGAGGNGASLSGICTVTPGHKLSIVVGSVGGGNLASWGSGGGGASYVYDSNTVTLLVAAAGGGGGGTMGNNSNGGAGGTNISTNATTAGQGTGGAGGISGNGGKASDAAGGAGWISNGGNGIGDSCGNDRANLFKGGTGAGGHSLPNNGGYGGGGGGGNDGGGGGGGYNGGGGDPGSGGGGGGSYLNGTVVGTPIANNTGNGSVSIKYGSAAGINDIASNTETINIYPNPGNGKFTLAISQAQPLAGTQTIEVYNVLGEKMYSTILNQAQQNYQIDLSSQPNGIYIYRVISANSGLVGQGKLIFQK